MILINRNEIVFRNNLKCSSNKTCLLFATDGLTKIKYDYKNDSQIGIECCYEIGQYDQCLNSIAYFFLIGKRHKFPSNTCSYLHKSKHQRLNEPSKIVSYPDIQSLLSKKSINSMILILICFIILSLFSSISSFFVDSCTVMKRSIGQVFRPYNSISTHSRGKFSDKYRPISSYESHSLRMHLSNAGSIISTHRYGSILRMSRESFRLCSTKVSKSSQDTDKMQMHDFPVIVLEKGNISCINFDVDDG